MASEPRTTPQICPSCGEKSPAQFDLCWSCGAELSPPTSGAEQTEASAAGVCEVRPPQDREPPPTLIATSPTFSKSFEWLELVGVVLLAEGSRILWHFLPHDAVSSDQSKGWVEWIPYYLGLSIMLWALVRRNPALVQPKLLRECRWPREVFFGLLIGLANFFIGAAVSMFFARLIPPESKFVEHVARESSGLLAITFLFAAAYEELLYRVYLQSKLEWLVPGRKALSILLPSLLFAAMHFYPFVLSCRVFATGVFFGVLYQNYRSVPRLVFGHWFYNLLVLYLQAT
jgi:membrane protease YdiL (CAAX protease family)